MDDYVLIVLIVACLLLFFSTCLLAVSRRRSIIKKTQLQRQISSQDEGALRAARIEPSELAVHELLGRGSFGEVSRATWRGTPVAVKRVRRHRARQARELRAFQEEAAMMLSLRHPNVVLLLGASWTLEGSQPQVCMVMELCSRGSLKAVLADASIHLGWAAQRLPIAQGVASALTYLHAQRLVHHDVKPDNVLLDAGFAPKLADFGSCRPLAARADVDGGSERASGGSDRRPSAARKRATPLFSAPEVLRNEAADETLDTWSFGCLLYCVHTRGPMGYPAHPTTDAALAAVAAGGARPALPPTSPFAATLERCTLGDAASRPPMLLILQLLNLDDTAALAAAADRLMWSGAAADDTAADGEAAADAAPRAGSPVGDDEAPVEEEAAAGSGGSGAHGTGDSTRSGLATERVVAIPPTESPVRRAAREERPTSPRPPADGGGGEDPPSPSVFYV